MALLSVLAAAKACRPRFKLSGGPNRKFEQPRNIHHVKISTQELRDVRWRRREECTIPKAP